MVGKLRSAQWWVALAVVASALLVVPPPSSAAEPIVVDTDFDDPILSQCTSAPSDCNLRAAVAAANANPGADIIEFAIPSCPDGVCRLELLNDPIEVTDTVFIDATTQPQGDGSHANVCATESEPSHPRIEIVAQPRGVDSTVFRINHGGAPSTIRGFAFGSNATSAITPAIDVISGTGHQIACNHFGVDASGTMALGTGSFAGLITINAAADGIVVGTNGDGIDDVAERNVFGGATTGVLVNGAAGNRISGNYFGYSADGTTTIESEGVFIRSGASDNLVGVEQDGISDEVEWNHLAASVPVEIDASGFNTIDNRVVGNVIGLSPAGAPVHVETGIRVTGLDPTDTGNEIRANRILYAYDYGIFVSGAGSDTTIDGNILGVTADGRLLGNLIDIFLEDDVSAVVSNNFMNNASMVGLYVHSRATLAAGSTGNCITGNPASGMESLSPATVIFESNWWGDAGGPAVGGGGPGVALFGDVDFEPWLVAPPATCATTLPDASFFVLENAVVGTDVGTLRAIGSGAPLTFSILAGDPKHVFAIDAAGGEITTAAPLDFETTPAYELTVEVDDGFTTDQAVVKIEIIDVEDRPRFDDVPATHVFYGDVEWLGVWGITRGCNPPVNDMFCPDAPLTRAQLAALLHRALDGTVTPGTPVAFTDIDESVFAKDIAWLAAAGITKGCNPPVNDMFCPDALVTREQVAAFLVRALGFTDTGGGDLFVDDDGSIFEDDIDRLAAAGVTLGCNPPANDRFCPAEVVTRGQMAAFLHRALGNS